MVSSWQRVGPNTIPHAAKATGVYLNSMLATHEARRERLRRGDHAHRRRLHRRRPGRDDLRGQGRDDLHAGLSSASILPGITRDTIIQIAQDLGYTVVEKPLIRTDLYTADEVFMTGTAVEVTPVRSVDDHEIGVGPVTLELQKAYRDTVTGKSERWSHWLDSRATAKPARSGYAVASSDLDDAVLIGVGERRAARQAEPALEEPRRHVAAVHRRVAEDRLEVHRLPQRPRLDVLRLEREPDRLAVGAGRVRVDEDAREPAVARARRRASGMNAIPGTSASSSR